MTFQIRIDYAFLLVQSNFRFKPHLLESQFRLLLSQGELAWHRLLTQRLSDEVKLVGPVISCEGAAYRGNTTGLWRTNPHVQSYAFAMEQAAISIFVQEGQVLQCHQDRWDAVFFGELGSSLAILNAGYNIDSFLVRYSNLKAQHSQCHVMIQCVCVCVCAPASLT